MVDLDTHIPFCMFILKTSQKRLLSFLLLLVFFAGPAFAQQITQPADSVSNLLCKKWTFVFAETNGRKISPRPGSSTPDLDFKKDKFVLFSNGGRTAAKGTWAYDRANKCVKITLDGKSGMTVVELQEHQLTMLISTKDATRDDPTPIKMVFKGK
jgi:hypothetical protein